MISKFTDGLKLNVGKELQIDEVQYSRRKHHNRKGVAVNWFIDSIDCETRYMVASEYVKAREQKALINVLRNAKRKTENQFEIITSDGLLACPKAIQKTFGLKNKSNTKKDGWLKISLDLQDARKSIYILKDPKETIEEIIKDKTKND